MGQKVRAAVLEAPSRMVIREFDMPEIGPDDGLLKVEMAGVCGTDPSIYTGKIKYGDLPLILGHEILGRIAKVGANASKRWGVKEGDRVIMEAVIRCGYCSRCLVGDYRFCENIQSYGTFVSCDVPPHLWGAYAEYMYLAPGVIPHKISEKVPAEAAVLVNAVVANSIHWGRLVGDFCIEDAVVIQGAGQQGLCLTIVAKASGCHPIIVTGLSSDANRFELAREFGADYTINVEEEDVVERVRGLTNGRMADVVVDVSGSTKGIQTSVNLIKKRGTVVVPATTGTQTQTPLIMDKLVHEDIKLVGIFASDARVMGKAVKLVESGKYAFHKIVTHKFPLEEAEMAVKTTGGYFKDAHSIKCVVVP
ncbi:MAG: alcohol dehydrogenase catalytic domain-containing protein [Dehalococcoidia bacterium]|nr:alcohol dehydrogenase catalytic domain-containing protein [Dehalococcoidia bacterium]